MAKIAINGLGRVGRQVLKHLITRYPELEIVAANDITDEQTLAHLLKYDSNYGTWDIDIEGKEGAIVIGGREVKIFREKDPAALPWGKLGIDIVIESTGMFTDADKARGHITAGAKKVLITAPAKGEDITIVLGVNEDLLDVSKHSIISNASCTTNSLAPVVKVLNDNWGVEKPFSTPQLSLSTLTTGASEFVVQEALEMMLCLDTSRRSSLTPRTIVISSPFAGAVIRTCLAPAVMCPRALSASVNIPVDSMTISIPNFLHGRAAGSFSRKILTSRPPMTIAPSLPSMSMSQVP